MKAQIDYPILILAGITVGILALFAMGKLGYNIWGLLGRHEEDAGTVNSFRLLQQQIADLREGEERLVPFNLGKKYAIVSGNENCPLTKLCLCKDPSCEEIVEQGIITLEGRQFSAVQISGEDWKGVENLLIRRTNNRILVQRPISAR
ncbi:MAG TPA: hypothetical protein VJK52_03290 [Candidatus Nanoarchaeia archaeon]|nr:hypothetical protein [Candidatus Nanoarchaeia archaeon]